MVAGSFTASMLPQLKSLLVLYTVYGVQCRLYTGDIVKYTVYCVHNTVYTVYYTVYSVASMGKMRCIIIPYYSPQEQKQQELEKYQNIEGT